MMPSGRHGSDACRERAQCCAGSPMRWTYISGCRMAPPRAASSSGSAPGRAPGLPRLRCPACRPPGPAPARPCCHPLGRLRGCFRRRHGLTESRLTPAELRAARELARAKFTSGERTARLP